MAFVWGSLSEYFEIFKKPVEDENLVFKLFTRASFVLCLLSAVLVGTTEFFGKPIICERAEDANGVGIGTEMVEGFCWINGGQHIDFTNKIKDYQTKWGCSVQEGTRESRNTMYYQWVPFMLVISGLLFRIPQMIWDQIEGGLMASFSDETAKTVAIHADDENKEKLKKSHVEMFEMLKSSQWANKFYYFKFFFCQTLNLFLLLANFSMTSKFLATDFWTYGSRVVDYYVNYAGVSDLKDPQCEVFPLAMNCTYIKYGSSGYPETHNSLCLLSQNIINEKIYLGLWFWFVFLSIIGCMQIAYEFVIICVPVLRKYLTLMSMGSKGNDDITRLIKSCDFADWFILKQIGKNTEKKFYREFIKALAESKAQKDQEEGQSVITSTNHGDEENEEKSKKSHVEVEMKDLNSQH